MKEAFYSHDSSKSCGVFNPVLQLRKVRLPKDLRVCMREREKDETQVYLTQSL